MTFGVTIKPLQTAAEFAIDLVYPKRCAGCSRRGPWLCAGCYDALALFKAPWCTRCGVPERYSTCKCTSAPGNLEQVRSVGPYEGWIRGAISHFKYHGEWARATYLGQLLASAVVDLQPIDVLVPVPLHPARLRHRGFNQSLLLARHAGKVIDVEVQDALIRSRRTDAQVTLGAVQRGVNVAGAFAIAPGRAVAGLSIVLIDDVVTTGSTLSACADASFAAGVSSVKAASVAREL